MIIKKRLTTKKDEQMQKYIQKEFELSEDEDQNNDRKKLNKLTTIN